MTEIKTFQEIIKDAMKERGFDIDRLAEVTGIGKNYLLFIIEEEEGVLPAAPYVRGYVENIADNLDLDFEEIWKLYNKTRKMKTSGEEDRLPFNRFAQKPMNRKVIIFTVVILLLLAYFVPKAAEFLGQPALEILSPSSDMVKVEEQLFKLEGKVKDDKDKVLINGEEVVVSSDGIFSKNVYLEEGQNTFQFKAERFLGKEATITRNILYYPTKVEVIPEVDGNPGGILNQ